ncbi:MAG: hypothetical protein ACE5OW_06735 [Candidatus Bathyarchaeia archaeon]
MEILVQEKLSQPRSRKVFASLSTEVLNLEDVILALSDVIDDEANGYYRLPFISARSQGMERLDAYTSLRKRRADKVYVVSNGRNTIYAMDYVVKTQRVYHDPVVYIVGPDAPEIAKKTLNNLTDLLLPKTYTLRLNERAIADFSRLRGCNKLTTIKKMEEIFEETELALKMALSDGKKNREERPSKMKELSREILEDIRRQRPPFLAEQLNPRDLIAFGIVFTLIILLLIILTRI